jgi:hypothetical protein
VEVSGGKGRRGEGKRRGMGSKVSEGCGGVEGVGENASDFL